MKVNKTVSAKIWINEVTKAAGPRRPLRKPPGKPGSPASPAKPARNKSAQPSPSPKKPAGK